MSKVYRKILIMSSFLVICGVILPNFCFAQGVEMPSTLEEAKDFLISIIKMLPEAMKEVWHNEVLPLWHKMAEIATNWFKSIQPALKSWLKGIVDWFSNIWYGTIKPWIQNAIDWIRNLINQRKPDLQQEFEKEKQGIKQEAPELSKSLWQKIKDIFK